MLRLFDFGVICYEIKNGRNILVWLATWGGSLPGQLRYTSAAIVQFAAICRKPQQRPQKKNPDIGFGFYLLRLYK